MTSSMQMLSDLAAHLGLQDLALNEQGLCSLTIDRDVTVFLQPVAASGMALFAGVGSVPADKAAQTCRALLESNHFWLQSGSFTLALAPGTLDVLLCGHADAAQGGTDGFGNVFDRFVACAAAWRRRMPVLLEETPQMAVSEMIRSHAGPVEPAALDAPDMIFRV